MSHATFRFDHEMIRLGYLFKLNRWKEASCAISIEFRTNGNEVVEIMRVESEMNEDDVIYGTTLTV